ncbi:MAG: glycosyltransferase, partial [Cyclonatronaceae bacterium]
MSAQNLPLVSVIIPTYNRPDFLRRAVASAQKQR